MATPQQHHIKEKVILGIDPGTNVMGYGVIKILERTPSMVAMGVIDMRKTDDPYLRLGHIFDRVTGIIEEYLPDEMAIEAPFFGKNVQSMLKLGRPKEWPSLRPFTTMYPFMNMLRSRLRWLSPVKVRPVKNKWQGCFKDF